VYAVINDRSRQYTVRVGDQIPFDLGAESKPGAKVTFKEVQLIGDEGKVRIGKPYLSGAQVVGEIVGPAQGKKLISMRFKRRKNVRRKHGHRQDYTLVKIAAIEG
jgi:large subunit ribosomal protein L21